MMQTYCVCSSVCAASFHHNGSCRGVYQFPSASYQITKNLFSGPKPHKYPISQFLQDGSLGTSWLNSLTGLQSKCGVMLRFLSGAQGPLAASLLVGRVHFLATVGSEGPVLPLPVCQGWLSSPRAHPEFLAMWPHRKFTTWMFSLFQAGPGKQAKKTLCFQRTPLIRSAPLSRQSPFCHIM